MPLFKLCNLSVDIIIMIAFSTVPFPDFSSISHNNECGGGGGERASHKTVRGFTEG